MERRQHKRYKTRCEIEYSCEIECSMKGTIYRGISRNLSLNGLFIRTRKPFASDVVINLTVHLPNGSTSQLKGITRRAVNNPVDNQKNGMGIELIEKDSHYLNFIDSIITRHEYSLDKIDCLF